MSATVHNIALGTIYVHSWGYDQTNVDFYEVTGLNGRTMVTLAPIGQDRRIATKVGMQGLTTPIPGQFIRDALNDRTEFRCKPYRYEREWLCKVRDFGGGARVWNGKPKEWTGYA